MPLDIGSSLKEYDAGLASTKKGMSEIQAKNADRPPITGPTAEGVNAAYGTVQPKTWQEFTARGGLQNSVETVQRKFRDKIDKDKMFDQYVQVLEAGERGADALYRDAVVLGGEEVKEYIPPRGVREWGSDKEKVSFYDENGVFLPHKYAQAVAVGVMKFSADQKEKQERMQAGSIIQSAETPQAAAAGVLQTGQDATQYKEQIGQVPSITDRASAFSSAASGENALASAAKTDADEAKVRTETEWLPRMNQATINERNANATKSRTGGVDRSTLQKQRLEGYRKNLVDFIGRREQLLNDNADPAKNIDPKARLERSKAIKTLDKAIKEVESDIEFIQREIGIDSKPAEEGVSEKAQMDAADILDSVSKSPPKGYSPITMASGRTSFSARGKPDEAAYNAEVASRVIQWAINNGWPEGVQLDAPTVQQGIAESSLEDVLDGILKAIEKSRQTTPQSPAVGTIQ